MKKRSERSVRELYDRTKTIDETEMTQVIEGNHRNQGPTELKKDLQSTKYDDNTAHQRNMFCGDMRTETGTCNVCAAPCSSCMHRIAMESNVDCESSDNMFYRNETDVCSFIGSKNRTSPNLQHAASEASNFLTVSSSHDSLSDNAESKATLHATITFGKTEAVGMPLKNLMIEKHGQAPVCHTNTAVTGKKSCVNSTLFVHQTALHKHESDCLGESDSCISGARDSCEQKSDQIADMEKKGASYCSALECDIAVNKSVKVNEICNSVETSQDKADKLSKCVVADPLDSGTNNPKYEASVECKMVSNLPSRLFKEEDPCSKEVSGHDGCDEAIKIASTSKQLETHIPINGESHLLDCHPEAHAVAESQTCESEVLFDVNVCDICGDAGKEDRLATCSRCLDGAEHIYCMRNMLDKLPEGDWLCEECQMKEESKKKRLSKSGSTSKLSKAHQLGEKIQNPGISVDCKNLPKSDMRSTDLEMSRPSECMKSPKKLDKKHMSHKDVISSTSKNVSQTRHVSTSPRKDVNSLPETSCKSSNLVIGKTSEIASSPRSLPTHSLQASSRSNASSSNLPKFERELHTPRKILQKQLSSDSLGIMSKPKQLLKARSEVISRELASRDIRKEGAIGILRKSASFKSSSSGQASYGLVSKSQTVKSPRTEEAKGFRPMKEGNMMEKKKSSVLECPVGKSSTSSVKPISQVDVKVESNAGNSNNRSEVSIISSGKVSDGNKEMFAAPKLKSHKITGTVNKKSVDAVKGVDRANSSVTTNTSKNVGAFLRPQIADTPNYTFQNDKDMNFVSSDSRQAVMGGDVQLHSHKLKALGSATDSCLDVKISIPSAKPSAKANLKKRDRCTDAVEAAINEKSQKCIKSFELTEEQKESNNNVIAELPPTSSSSSRIHGKSLLSEAKSDGDKSLKNNDDVAGKREGPQAEQLEFDLNTALTIPDDLKEEPSFQCMTDRTSLLSSSLGASSFPQHDFIWRGDFEISRTGRHPEVVKGIQAHLSFSASPKVPEVAGQFPCKIQLVEVPRVSSWPRQFQETSPTDENIALYFFAEDFESYEKSYQRLLDDMLKSDLALIGRINEVDILIFHSNTLPEASQRWNTLFFLWGVFRGRKSDSSNAHANNLQEGSNCFELMNDTSVQKAVSFQKIVSVDSPKEKMNRSGKSVKVSIVNPDNSVFYSLSPAEARDHICKMDESPIERAFGEAVGTGSCQKLDNASHSCSMNWLTGSVGSFQGPMKASLNSLELNGERPCATMTGNGAFSGHTDNAEATKGFHVQARDEETANKPFSGLFVPPEFVRSGKSNVPLEETNKRHLDLCSTPFSTPVQVETSTGTLKSKIFQDSTHFLFGEDDQTSKRVKFCSDRRDIGIFRDTDEANKSTTSNVCLFSGVGLGQRQIENSYCSGLMPENSELADNPNPGPINFIDVSSDDDDCPNYSTIDLNLALGPGKRPLKETLASVSQFNSDRKGKLPNSSADDDLNISDSLSLALPLAKTGKLMQKSFKTEKLFPEEPEEGSTSLTLFWDGT